MKGGAGSFHVPGAGLHNNARRHARPSCMVVKRIFFTLLGLLVFAVAWHFGSSDAVRQAFAPAPPPPPPFKFDNGTVRQYEPASAPDAGADTRPVHALRKCARGKEVVYTDRPCAEGFRDLSISQGTVNVVPAAVVATSRAASAPTGRATIRDALAPPDENLQQRRIDRIVDR